MKHHTDKEYKELKKLWNNQCYNIKKLQARIKELEDSKYWQIYDLQKQQLKNALENLDTAEARIKELEVENERLWVIVNAAVPYVEDPR